MKDVVARIVNIKSANCFSQTNSPNITLTNKYSCMVYKREIDTYIREEAEGNCRSEVKGCILYVSMSVCVYSLIYNVILCVSVFCSTGLMYLVTCSLFFCTMYTRMPLSGLYKCGR